VRFKAAMKVAPSATPKDLAQFLEQIRASVNSTEGA
jgi:hypothetical protein